MKRFSDALPAYLGGKRKYRPGIKAVQVPYRHLASIVTEEKNEGNREFIILATA